MPPLCCFVFWLLLLSSVSNPSRNSALAGSGGEGKLTGPEIDVTKHFSFPDFSSVGNPRVQHEVKLLGSAKLSLEEGTVQIPDVSGAVDSRHLAGRALYSFPVRLLDPVTNTQAWFETTFSFQFKDGFCHQARIRYDGVKRFGSFGKELPLEPAFSGPLDLSDFLAEYMFVGFSASTGNLTQIHNVLSWNFTSMSRASLRMSSAESCEAKITLPNSHATGHPKNKPTNKFFIFVAVVVLVLVVIASLFYHRNHRDNQSSITNFTEEVKGVGGAIVGSDLIRVCSKGFCLGRRKVTGGGR